MQCSPICIGNSSAQSSQALGSSTAAAECQAFNAASLQVSQQLHKPNSMDREPSVSLRRTCIVTNQLSVCLSFVHMPMFSFVCFKTACCSALQNLFYIGLFLSSAMIQGLLSFAASFVLVGCRADHANYVALTLPLARL